MTTFTKGERINVISQISEVCDRVSVGDLVGMTQEYKDGLIRYNMRFATNILKKFGVTQKTYNEVVEEALQVLDFYNIPRAILNN